MRGLLAFAAAGVVPRGTEFAAAPDVCDDAGAAAFEPELADGGVVVRQLGDAKAAISREMDWRLAGLPGWTHLDIGNARAVGRCRFVAGDDQTRRVKRTRRSLEELRRRSWRDQVKGGRRQRILRAGKQIPVRLFGPNVE